MSDYQEMAAWLEDVKRKAREYRDGIEHTMIPAGTESLAISLDKLASSAQQARYLVGVICPEARTKEHG